MACNTLSLAPSPAMAATHSTLLSSASSPFVASFTPAMVAPFSSSTSLKSLSVTCSLSQKDATSTPVASAGKAILTGLVAAGAALSVFVADTASTSPALAAMGPGTSGAERTAQKAQDLLKSADKLNVDDAPQRYGPGRVAGSAQDAGKVAQDAGGKALSQLQGGVSNLTSGLSGKKGEVQDAAENAASQVKDSVDDASSSGGPGGILGSIKEGLQGLKESVASKDADAKKTLDETVSNVRNTVQ